MIKILKKIIYVYFPILGRLYGALSNKKGHYHYSGWGMTTTSSFPPWKNIINDKKNVHNIFLKIHNNLKKKIKEGKFRTSYDEFKDLKKHFQRLYFLKWRYYIVFISALYASNYTKSKKKNLVECGVGLSLIHI